MIPESFKAFYVDKDLRCSIVELPTSVLPDHEVVIDVHFSSLNYKDALSARGLNAVTKTYPHIPGIDAVGKVIVDTSDTFQIGDWVIVTGNDLGTNTFGGFGGVIRVPKNWVVKKPDSLTPFQAMIVGTAGFTALYGIYRLQVEHIMPDSGSILVTGATGGVGSFAVFALSNLGYEVIAASRKIDIDDFLISLGAIEVVNYKSITADNSRPLQPRKWMGAIETVGGELLHTVLTQTAPKGAVACCGNVLGIDLSTNVLPFILRGISLLGIDSAFCARAIREKLWQQVSEMDFSSLPEGYVKEVPLKKLNTEIDLILKGEQKGRVIISHK